jgi:hypothetical protein
MARVEALPGTVGDKAWDWAVTPGAELGRKHIAPHPPVFPVRVAGKGLRESGGSSVGARKNSQRMRPRLFVDGFEKKGCPRVCAGMGNKES